MRKIMKSIRLDKMIIDEIKILSKMLGITETKFIEMAIIEKITRIEAKKGI